MRTAVPETGTPLDVLADAIHPFPMTVHVLCGLFGEASRGES
jgi:hypothetical protein